MQHSIFQVQYIFNHGITLSVSWQHLVDSYITFASAFKFQCEMYFTGRGRSCPELRSAIGSWAGHPEERTLYPRNCRFKHLWFVTYKRFSFWLCRNNWNRLESFWKNFVRMGVSSQKDHKGWLYPLGVRGLTILSVSSSTKWRFCVTGGIKCVHSVLPVVWQKCLLKTKEICCRFGLNNLSTMPIQVAMHGKRACLLFKTGKRYSPLVNPNSRYILLGACHI